MTKLGEVILRDVVGNRPVVGIEGRLFYDTTNEKLQRDTGAAWEDCEPAPGLGDVTWAIIQASQLVNEVMNYPSYGGIDEDLATLNLWWDKVGTPTTAVTMVDLAGEGGSTETWEYALKTVCDAAAEGFYQRYTYADQPRIKSGRKLSAIAAVWVGTAGTTVTMKLITDNPTEVSATATAQAWTIIKCESLTLDGTYVDLQFTTDTADTFYVVPLGVCIGEKAVPLPPRLGRWDGVIVDAIVNGVDPGGADYTDLDLTANTSPLTFAVQLLGIYANATAASQSLNIRQNGTADDASTSIVRTIAASGSASRGHKLVWLDDGQVCEWKTTGAAANNESVSISLVGYQEWA